MNILKGIGIVVGSIVVVFLVILGSLQFYKFFAPKYEGARREVFEKTRSYNQAKIQELAKYRLEYLRADDPAEKEAIASTIRHRFADYDKRNLSYELSMFLDEINN